MKRVLVTGATGFVGANLARRLVHDGHDVHLLVREAHDPWRLEGLRGDVSLHVADLEDPAALGRTVGRISPEWVFHLAAHGAYSWQTDLGRMIATNLAGTANLLDACARAGFEAFVNTGSSSEYGFKDHPPSEREWLEPNSHYAVTKASATHLCRFTAQAKGLHVATLRLYSLYGPYEEPRRLLPSLVVFGMRGASPPLTSPDVARDFLYVEDAVDAYLLAAAAPSPEPGVIYNVGSGVQTPLRRVVDTVRQFLGVPGEPVWGSMPDRAWDTSVWVADARKIRDDLGWRPTREIGDGVRRTAAWLREDEKLLDLYERRLGIRE